MTCKVLKDEHGMSGYDVFDKAGIISASLQPFIYMLKILKIDFMNIFEYEIFIVGTAKRLV